VLQKRSDCAGSSATSRSGSSMEHADIKPGISIQTAAIDLVAAAQRRVVTVTARFHGVDLVVTPTTTVSEVIDFFDAAVQPEEG
jgi:hypothetical protein